MPIYEETSGQSVEQIYGARSWNASVWGRSWSIFWGFSWGFIQDTPFLDGEGTPPDSIYEETSGLGPDQYSGTSGTAPDLPYEEN